MKRLIMSFGAGVLAFSLAACAAPVSEGKISESSAPSLTSESSPASSGEAVSSGETAQKVTFTDAHGRTVTVEKPQKVAACLASYGEVWQLAGGKLAGVTKEAWSEREMKLDGVEDLGANDEPSAEKIVAEGYDFVLLSSGKRAQTALSETLDRLGVAHAFFDVETFDGYLQMLKICTDITGRADLYEQNGLAHQKAIAEIVEKAQKQETHPKVLLLRAQSSGVKARRSDNMVGAELSDLGCVNIAETDDSLLENLSMEAILNAEPDFIFIVTMGSAENAAKALKEQLTADPAWQTLTAVRENRVYSLEKELFQYKPNARWSEAYERLYSILYEYGE